MSDPQVEEHSWECPRCTYHNHAALMTCEMCEASRPTYQSIQDGGEVLAPISQERDKISQQAESYQEPRTINNQHVQSQIPEHPALSPENYPSEEQVGVSYAWISPPQVLSPSVDTIHSTHTSQAVMGPSQVSISNSGGIAAVRGHRDIYTYQYPLSPHQPKANAASPESVPIRREQPSMRNQYPYYQRSPSVQPTVPPSAQQHGSPFYSHQPIPKQIPSATVSSSLRPASTASSKPTNKPVFCRLKATLLVVGARYHGTFMLTEDEIEFKGQLIPLGLHPNSVNKRADLDRIASLLGTDHDTPSRVCVRISMTNLRLAMRRTYFRIPIAMELFTFLKSPAHSTFLVFDQHLSLEQALRQRSDLTRERDTILNLLRKLIRHPIEQSAEDVLKELDLPRRWVNGSMSTYDYLCWLNIISGRSFHDITMYPIFPVILAPGSAHSLNLSDRRAFRDLTQPLHVIASKALGLDPQRVMPKVKVSKWDNIDEDQSSLKESGKLGSPQAQNIDSTPLSPSESESMLSKRKPVLSDLLPEALASYPPMFYGSPATMLAPALRDSRILRASVELNNGYLGCQGEGTTNNLDLKGSQYGQTTMYSLGAATISSVEQVLRKAFTDRCAASEIAPFWFCGDPGRIHVMGDDIVFVPDENESYHSSVATEAKSILLDDGGDVKVSSSDDILYDLNGNEEHSVGPSSSYLSPVHSIGKQQLAITLHDTSMTNLRSVQAILESGEFLKETPSDQINSEIMNSSQTVETDQEHHIMCQSDQLKSILSPASVASTTILSPSASVLSQRKLRLTNVLWLSAADMERGGQCMKKEGEGSREESVIECPESKQEFQNEYISDIQSLPVLPRSDSSTLLSITSPDKKKRKSRPAKRTDMDKIVAAITDTLRRLSTPVVLPMWAVNDPDIFLRLHRAALESPIVSLQLHKWIDMVFGVDQQGPRAEAIGNVYFPSVYLRNLPQQPQSLHAALEFSPVSSPSDQSKHFHMEGVAKDIQELVSDQSDIDVDILFEAVAYGTCPEMIFTSPHPQRDKLF